MWLRRFTNYILQHRLQALVLTFMVTIIPVVGIVGILIAALVTLVKGVVEGAIFTLAASFPYFIGLYKGQTGLPGSQFMLWGAGVAVVCNILTWVFAVLLKKGMSWSKLLQVAALLGVLVISVIHLAYPNVADWWGEQLLSSLKQANTILNTTTTPTNMDAQIETINVSKSYASGALTGIILLNALIQLMVARWWQAFMFQPGTLRLELHQIRLSPLAGLLFVISIIFAYLGNSVVWDIMPIIYLLFAGAGLSVIHYAFGMMGPMAWFWLALLYTTVLLSMPMSLFLLALIALIDIWVNLRRRFKKI